MEITRIKKAISCKQVTKFKLDKEKASYYIPKAGDVAVFEVKTIGLEWRVDDEPFIDRRS